MQLICDRTNVDRGVPLVFNRYAGTSAKIEGTASGFNLRRTNERPGTLSLSFSTGGVCVLVVSNIIGWFKMQGTYRRMLRWCKILPGICCNPLLTQFFVVMRKTVELYILIGLCTFIATFTAECWTFVNHVSTLSAVSDNPTSRGYIHIEKV